MVTMAAVEGGGGGGVRASMADGSLLETLKRLKSNDRDLTEFKTPPTIMQELQASTLELIKIISDCLVFNTHLKVCAAFSAFALSSFVLLEPNSLRHVLRRNWICRVAR
jgi:hypothetical protein